MIKFIIPDRFLSVDYEKDVPEAIKDVVGKFKTERKGLYLHGNAGTGKTHVAYAICKHLSDKGIAVRAFKVIDVLKMIRDDMDFKNNDRDLNYHGDRHFGDINSNYHTDFLDGINKYKSVVFLDDLGTEKETEWAHQTLYEIIDKKYEDFLPVIITSNLSPSELGNKMGDRIASRIVEMCEIFEMTGIDKRLAKNLNQNE